MSFHVKQKVTRVQRFLLVPIGGQVGGVGRRTRDRKVEQSLFKVAFHELLFFK